jgi:transcriptional regulator with XRE-family HTH domain
MNRAIELYQLGKRLGEAYKVKGLTWEEIANEIGMGVTTEDLANIRRGNGVNLLKTDEISRWLDRDNH